MATLRSLARVVAAPILIAQALQVRRIALRLPEAEGPRRGCTGQGPIRRLLVLGDSAAAGVGATTQDQALLGRLVGELQSRHLVSYELIARSGWRCADALAAMRHVAPRPLDDVVLSLGVNDATRHTPLAELERQLRALIALLTDRFGATRVVLSGLPPLGRFPLLPQPLRWFLGARAREVDRLLEQVARSAGVDYLKLDFSVGFGVEQMASDGFHPGPEIYHHWARELALRLHGQPAVEDAR